MTPLKSTGISAASQKRLRSLRVHSAASSVASVPKTMSKIVQPPRMFASRQPTASAGTASGSRMGKRVSASEKRICTSP